MRVLQLIDSLSVGGAERVAVNFANALAENGVDSFLCSTRKEGDLRRLLGNDVGYLFLNRKGRFDIKSVKRLIEFCKDNNIDIIHAHSTSLLLAFIVGWFCKVKLVWHNHYGNSVQLSSLSLTVYRLLLSRVSYSFFVTVGLYDWGVNKLGLNKNKSQYLPNYPDIRPSGSDIDSQLNDTNRKFIVSLANLRPEKNHPLLIEAFGRLSDDFKEWSIVFIGRDFNDDYSGTVKRIINENGLAHRVLLLGVRNDIYNLLSKCHIGVVSSNWEGLPVSLLEYGLVGLPVVATAVGEIPEVLKNGKYGLLVESGNCDALAQTLKKMMESHSLREQYGHDFHNHVIANYSKEAVVEQLVNVYNIILKGNE